MILVDAVSLTREGRRRRTARRLRISAALLALLLLLPFLLQPAALFVLAGLGGPILPLLGAYVLISIARGPTSVVVYLRRFGRMRQGRAVTSALEAGVSRRHRFVTLDDSRFPPLEVPPWERRLSRYLPPLVAGLLVLVFVLIVRALRQQEDYLFLWLSAGAIPVLVASLWSLLTVYLLFVIHRARVRRLARGRVTSEADLAARAGATARLRAWWRAPGIAAPQATVLSVDDGIWQQAVDLLVRVSDAVLIDISEPTDNLAWEIQTVLQYAATRAVFVGERQATSLWSADVNAARDPVLTGRIGGLIAEQSVLTYDVSDHRGRRLFRQSMMRALDNVVLPRPARRPGDRVSVPRRRFASYVPVALAYFLAPVTASVLSFVMLKVADPQQAVGNIFWKPHHVLDRLTSPKTELERRGVPITPGALARAAHDGETDTVERLLQAGVRQAPMSANWTPLLLAAHGGDAATLRTLVSAGANVHDRTDDGRSAVMLAAAGGHLAAIQTLVDASADVNVAGAQRTPLGLAIQGGYGDLVELLLDRGADVSARHLGMSPLLLAAALGRADIIEGLLERGADVNDRSEAGRTALGLASIASCAGCIRALLSKGAPVDAVDGFGETASSYAVFRGDSATVALLERAGARLAAPVNRRPEKQSQGTDRSKAHVNLAVISTADRQAPALASAITRVLDPTAARSLFLPAEQIEARRQGPLRRSPRGDFDPHGMHLELSTTGRHYALCVPASDHDFRKASMSGDCHADTVLVVAMPRGPDPRLEELVQFLRQAGVADVVVAIDGEARKVDGLRADADEPSIRRMLERHGYGAAPIVNVSSFGALSHDATGTASIGELLSVLDGRPLPRRAKDAPLVMAVENAFEVKDRGAVVTGRIEAGTVQPGDEVEVVGLGPARTTFVRAIEDFRKLLDMAVAGDRVGVILQGFSAADVKRGQVIAKPGTIQAYVRCEAIVYLLSPDEGGRQAPVADGYRPFVTIRTAMATAAFTFPRASGLRPGQTAPARLDLLTPVAMTPGLRFILHEGTRTVGVGVITSVG